jgi:hypothetical protein
MPSEHAAGHAQLAGAGIHSGGYRTR